MESVLHLVIIQVAHAKDIGAWFHTVEDEIAETVRVSWMAAIEVYDSVRNRLECSDVDGLSFDARRTAKGHPSAARTRFICKSAWRGGQWGGA